jgi:hypothetical protein
MTKMIKMSLIAATAVTGMTSVATAQPLEEAIKGVDVSGYVDYRREYKSTEGVKSADINEYSVNVTLTSKVNDIVKATVSAGFDEVQTANTGTTGVAGDTTAALSVDQAFFTFNLGKATVMAGKQSIPSVFVDQADTVKQGDGLVAQYGVSDALTVVGAHFTNTNFAFEAKTTELVAVGKVADLSYEARYNTTDVVAAEADRLFFKVGAKVAGVSLAGTYASASQDGANGNATKYDDSSVMSLSAAANVASAKITGIYFAADKSGTNTATDVAIDGDNDSQAHVKLWQLSTGAIANKGSGIALIGDMPVADQLTARLAYGMATDDKGRANAADIDYTETLVALTYKMSKNFSIHGRYSMLNKETTGTDATTDYSRIQVKYTF